MKQQKRLYVVVKIDVEFDENIIENKDVANEAAAQFNYDFKLDETTGITVTETEICSVSSEIYD